jgi:hypothetical protein
MKSTQYLFFLLIVFVGCAPVKKSFDAYVYDAGPIVSYKEKVGEFAYALDLNSTNNTYKVGPYSHWVSTDIIKVHKVKKYIFENFAVFFLQCNTLKHPDEIVTFMASINSNRPYYVETREQMKEKMYTINFEKNIFDFDDFSVVEEWDQDSFRVIFDNKYYQIYKYNGNNNGPVEMLIQPKLDCVQNRVEKTTTFDGAYDTGNNEEIILKKVKIEKIEIKKENFELDLVE